MSTNYRSISPKTISNDPILATTSASICPRDMKSKALQMGKAGGADAAAVGPVGAVRYQIHAKLSLGGFDGRICFTRWNVIAFGE
jgi:hypothetical protein